MTSARARAGRNVGLFRQRNKHYNLHSKNLHTMRLRSLSGKGSFTLNKFLILKVELSNLMSMGLQNRSISLCTLCCATPEKCPMQGILKYSWETPVARHLLKVCVVPYYCSRDITVEGHVGIEILTQNSQCISICNESQSFLVLLTIIFQKFEAHVFTSLFAQQRVDILVTSVLVIGQQPPQCKQFTSNRKEYRFVSEETKQKVNFQLTFFVFKKFYRKQCSHYVRAWL